MTLFSQDQRLHPVRHRWLVAVPIVLFLVVCTIGEGVRREEGIHPAANEGDAVWGAGGLLSDPGTVIEILDEETVQITEGGLLVATRGLATIRAGVWEVHVWGGSVYVVVQSGHITVAALETPVLVSGAGGMVVVEPHSQWRAPATVPSDVEDPIEWFEAQSAQQPLPDFFRTEQEARVRTLALPPVHAVSPVTPAQLAAMSTSDLATLALAADPSPVLAAAVRSRSVLRSYALLHPGFRDVAWAYLPSVVDEWPWMGLLLLPRLERMSDHASPLTVRKWGEALHAAIDTSTSSGALRSSVVSIMEREIHAMVKQGTPVRALRFAEALREAVGTGALLTDRARNALVSLSAMTPDTLRASVVSDASPLFADPTPTMHRIDAPVATEPDIGLEQRVRDLLLARGGMFTSQTTIRTVEPGAVEVQDIVFGLPHGDRALHFTYAPDADAVQVIMHGILQPYTLTLEQYIAWEAGR